MSIEDTIMMSLGISYISNAFEKQEIKGRSPKLYVLLLRLLQQHFWNGGKSAFVAIKNISTCVQQKDVEKDFSTTHKKLCYETDYQTFQSRLKWVISQESS